MPLRALMVALMLTAAATVATGADAVLNRDYTLLKRPQRTDSPGKIEVIEFFSYGCPHCADLHPRVTAWAARLPADTILKRIPVGFGRPAWTHLAKTYYALESMGEVAKVDSALYDAIHRQRLRLEDERSIAAWMAKQGVDAGQFSAAFNSFGVYNKVENAAAMSMTYRISGVPTFTVNGKYAVIGRNEEQILATTDALIAKARAETGAAQR